MYISLILLVASFISNRKEAQEIFSLNSFPLFDEIPL